ncbi:hypothetical protein SPRG_09627 [Saprolegnia parasitica CBS 223.65]|uniref:Uncharacterized protein n=1 Tax=Saprolegnia parasitica (strain CBS 223.65) TaxID=695850 RepID=A0A067CE04_SAPPC|nr:hypothetical protein SPRG_09627 [Saprolegnia parasitica CBS 223.65]KDO24766.1 hypothetical protein SPRG_09627 [Saprolegnia parasitica CBS 223.65]|eukprot:XP_012204443.1 hypothetical protein SPRG_09627 [Saprolegnia parasitica CBS 223.65]
MAYAEFWRQRRVVDEPYCLPYPVSSICGVNVGIVVGFVLFLIVFILLPKLRMSTQPPMVHEVATRLVPSMPTEDKTVQPENDEGDKKDK